MSDGGSSIGRIDHLDGLRAALMLLGIPFHAALAFSGGGWLVSSPVDSPVLVAVADFLHAWRMPAFFVVAGFFAGLLVTRRGPGSWFRGRLRRLGLPLVAGVVLTVPLQWVLIGLHRYGTWPETWRFVERLAASPSEWWLLHLWFLLDLLVYCAVLAAVVASPLRSVLRRCCDAVAASARRHPALTAVAVLAVAVAGGLLGRAAWRFLELDEVLGGILTRNLVLYAPAFAIGVLLGARRELLGRLTSRAAATAFAITAVVAAIVGSAVPDTFAGTVVHSAAWTILGLSAAAVAISAASRFLDRPRRLVRWLVDASLVVYLVHQPIILALAVALFALGVYGLVGWTVTVVAALVLAAVAYELVNLTPGLRFLLTGRAARQTSLLQRGERVRRG